MIHDNFLWNLAPPQSMTPFENQLCLDTNCSNKLSFDTKCRHLYVFLIKIFGHDWENDILKGFSIDFLKILMVPPSFAQILSWKIIKEKVFGDERRFLFFFKKWCTEAYIRSRVHEYKVILCPDEPHPCVLKSGLLSEVIASHSLKPGFPSEITESHLLKRGLPPEMTVSHLFKTCFENILNFCSSFI